MLSKTKLIKAISEEYKISENFIDLCKEDGVYFLTGKLGSVLPMTEMGRLTMKDSTESFMESVKYLISQFEGKCIVTYINSIDWEVRGV